MATFVAKIRTNYSNSFPSYRQNGFVELLHELITILNYNNVPNFLLKEHEYLPFSVQSGGGLQKNQ